MDYSSFPNSRLGTQLSSKLRFVRWNAISACVARSEEICGLADYGLRWQAQRDTALRVGAHLQSTAEISIGRLNKSAVAASLCRRTPKDFKFP